MMSSRKYMYIFQANKIKINDLSCPSKYNAIMITFILFNNKNIILTDNFWIVLNCAFTYNINIHYDTHPDTLHVFLQVPCCEEKQRYPNIITLPLQ